ncbi:MAG: alpha/beta family hydrolase [Planctomycetota bacterium]
MTLREDVQIRVPHQGAEHVGGRIDLPDGDPCAVYVLAHGSGAPMTSAFLEGVAPRIAAAARVAVLRFNYAYAERMARTGRTTPPERRPALEAVHGAALGYARARFEGLPLLAGGKSLGGRIASLMAADGEPMDGLVFLGYPLHPAGKKDRLRTDHFPQLETPSLFVQGTRDALADLELLRPALEQCVCPTKLHVVEGADHSFAVLRRSGREPENVLDEVAAAVSDWVSARTSAD